MNPAPASHQVACAIIEREGEILIARRKPGIKLGLKWEFPGGKLEAGETVEECIIREIKEELNLDISVRYRLKENYHSYGETGIHLYPCVCSIINTSAMHLRDHSEVRWIKPEEIFTFELAEADIPAARAYLDQKRV